MQPAPPSADYLTHVFGPRGYFAHRFPGYEPRPGQVALARMVDQAMATERHALGEGPCGTGKGVAYLVPAIYHALRTKGRVVVVTANIALQEQLVRKDLPMLAEVLPWQFSFALLKGRSNYLCAVEHSGRKDPLTDPALAAQEAAIRRWAEDTDTGDVSDLDFVPAAQVWARHSITSDDCPAGKCPLAADCFSQRAIARAKRAHIVVTNYHMLFAHIAVREQTGQDLVLPPFDFLVLDEAHAAAGIARDFFGFKRSEMSARKLLGAAEKFKSKPFSLELEAHAAEFFASLAEHHAKLGAKRIKRSGFTDAAPLASALDKLAAAAGAAAEAIEGDRLRAAEHKRTLARSRQAANLAADIREAVDLADPNKVYWVELDRWQRPHLCAKPVDVHHILRTAMFERAKSVVAVSATLTTAGGSFDFVRAELGMPSGLELEVPSPFNFPAQALLVLPPPLPDPKDPGFVPAVTRHLAAVVKACGGRTLGLFTSYRNLNAVADALGRLPYRVLRQGELPRPELTRIFKHDETSVLLGTESFWTGIDVPGPALTAVVVDKLPFAQPDDPVTEAICARDPKAFTNYLLPLAMIALRQGVGRLIRSQTDAGVVVLLDPRLTTKGYGKLFLSSLPPMRRARSLDAIGPFLASQKGPAHAR